MIPVTKPFLPPKEEVYALLDGIWQRNWLTNNGPLVNELELRLKKHLQLPHLLYLSNGTIALQIAIKALELKGEIISTPFSYVATTSSIVWEGCTPVFVDIDPNTFNIDPTKIEAAITPQTSAILATHVYGNPCDVESIANIAQRHGLKIIYDGAHCFGTKYKGESIFKWGDISTASFHATKIFHTIEGGAVMTTDPELLKRMVYLRNFGHDGTEQFNGIGINGKNSELHAAVGLCVLNYMEVIRQRRKEQYEYYFEKLSKLPVRFITVSEEVTFNYAYCPIIFSSEKGLIKAKEALERQNITPRRYFYPGLNQLDYVENRAMPVSDEASRCVLCLPVYHELSKEEQDMIIRIILRSQRY